MVELNVVVAVLYHPKAPTKKNMALGWQTSAKEEDDWNPRPVDAQHAANLVCVWADPYWTGLTCHAVGPPHVSGNHGVSTVFCVRGTLRPTPIPIAAGDTRRRSGDSPDAVRSLCNSIKMHFFRESFDKGSGETRRDFLYACAFPLASLWRTPQRGQCYGAFNYNRLDVSMAPISKMCIAVTPCGPPSQPPPGVTLLGVACPDEANHERVMSFTNWAVKALKAICPRSHSIFCNMRTYCRDQNNTGLFQDLYALFDTPWTELPFTLALYALCGALQVNGLWPPERLAAECLSSDAPQAMRMAGLRILRDSVACFTLCITEGIYWSDTSLGSSVEDQPFPLSFMPSERVFAKDDCEGRACQVQVMKLLFKCLHRRRSQAGRAQTLSEIRALPSFGPLLGKLPPDAVDALLDAAAAMGALLEAEVLNVVTVVGDVHFASMHVRSPSQPIVVDILIPRSIRMGADGHHFGGGHRATATAIVVHVDI